MTKLEVLHQEIIDAQIEIVNVELNDLIGVAVKLRNKRHIVIDKTKIKNKTHEHTVLAHEFCHLKTETLYRISDYSIVKDKKEYRCNKYMVQKLVPVEEFKRLLSDNYQKWEIAFHFEIEECVVDLAFNIYKRMGLIY